MDNQQQLPTTTITTRITIEGNEDPDRVATAFAKSLSELGYEEVTVKPVRLRNDHPMALAFIGAFIFGAIFYAALAKLVML